jgi:DNA (cytosine-5)-methyltransferase 1
MWVVFENVSEMAWTVIEDGAGELRPILDIIAERLSPEYVGGAYDLELADYGVPQRRRRLITVYTRDPRGRAFLADGGALVPPTTHAQRAGIGELPWLSVAETIKDFPPLDASTKETAQSDLPFHRVPLLDERKYWWVSATPPGAGAFDNQCTACGYDRNPAHGNRRTDDGINRARTTTPVYCERCGELLPRPSVQGEDGMARIMKGYTSAYKRMAGNLPAPALTRNLSYACSDQKVHPTQNRVLSLAEAFAVHTLADYVYVWGSPRPVRDGLIALMLGESIPPRFMELLGRHLLSLAADTASTVSSLRWPVPVGPRKARVPVLIKKEPATPGARGAEPSGVDRRQLAVWE